MPNTHPCSAPGCGLRLDKPDSWCISCEPRQTVPNRPAYKAESVQTEHQIRMQIWHNAYKLALGTRAEQTSALETLAHLVAQLKEIQ